VQEQQRQRWRQEEGKTANIAVTPPWHSWLRSMRQLLQEQQQQQRLQEEGKGCKHGSNSLAHLAKEYEAASAGAAAAAAAAAGGG
jgi:hypothetical protein